MTGEVTAAVGKAAWEGVPFSCDICRARGSPHGVLVFPSDGIYPPIECKYHRTPVPMTRSRHYDPNGNRLKENQ